MVTAKNFDLHNVIFFTLMFFIRTQCDFCHKYDPTHLSKWPSDLKSNGTQENITFSGPVFHGLSCGIFLFVASVSFKNHLLNGLNFSTANQVLLFYGFWS